MDRLPAYKNNARTHSEAQIKQIARAIEEFGFTSPILADSEGIVAGHGRKTALERLHAAGKGVRMASGAPIPAGFAPVIDCKGWTQAQRRSYVLADNRIALNAGWDSKLLGVELAELEGLGADLSLLGFDVAEIRQLKRGPGGAEADDAPAPPKKPVSRPGDLYILGDHRVLCGDSTSKADVARLFGGAAPHLMVTDPPYGVEYDANWRNERDRSNGKPYGARAVGLVSNDDRADWREAWALFPGEVVYVWHAGLRARQVVESLEAAGFEMRAQIIWAKGSLAIGRGHYHFQHEPCWYAVRQGGKAHWSGDRKQTTLWQIDKPMKSETGHSTQKPVECMRRPMLNNSKPGDAVYDPFLGSGTSVIAAEMEARRCYGLELNPAYVDVIVARWEAYAGGKAVRERPS